MDKIKAVIKNITGIDYVVMEKTQKRLNALTKPQGSLGRLEELAKLITGITGKENPSLQKKVIFTFAGDHGVTDEGVSAYPKEVTAQMVYNFLNGGAAINVLAKHIGAKVIVADLGVVGEIQNISTECIKPCFDGEPAVKTRTIEFKQKKIGFGTKNMAEGPAMTKDEAVKSIEAGIEIFEEEFKNGISITGIGEMGIGNTTAASALASVFTKSEVSDVTGRGTGIDDNRLENKIRVIKESIKINKPDSCDAIDVLSKVGGFEIGGLAGVILASASKKIPVVIDGFISSAAALIAFCIEPKIRDYMIASHCSVEKGHKIILKHLGLKPVLDLDMRLGEGTGAALGINIADASIKILTEMATFESAHVSKKE
jgi:nicotinate-nucleotide--dimethylbenzimidazole phosphoribosyltransferase